MAPSPSVSARRRVGDRAGTRGSAPPGGVGPGRSLDRRVSHRRDTASASAAIGQDRREARPGPRPGSRDSEPDGGAVVERHRGRLVQCGGQGRDAVADGRARRRTSGAVRRDASRGRRTVAAATAGQPGPGATSRRGRSPRGRRAPRCWWPRRRRPDRPGRPSRAGRRRSRSGWSRRRSARTSCRPARPSAGPQPHDRRRHRAVAPSRGA